MDESERDATYTLEPLQNGTFNYAGNEVIESVTLSEVTLAIRGSTNPKITIRSSDVLKTLRDDITGINLRSGNFVHAKLVFRLEEDGKSRKVAFEITPPNVTELTTKKYADIISAYLKESGVKLV